MREQRGKKALTESEAENGGRSAAKEESRVSVLGGMTAVESEG